MLCPVCEHSLEETSATCPGCGFCLTLADAHFGTCPQAGVHVSDPARYLSLRAKLTLIKASIDFEQRFPGLRLTTLLHEAPSGVPPRPYFFWMFNRCGLHSAIEKGGSNRHVMLWIDPGTGKISAMVGYGLEPIVSDSLLAQALEAAAGPASTGQWAQAGISFIQSLDRALADIQTHLPTLFGWFPEATWTALEDDFDPMEKDLSSATLVY